MLFKFQIICSTLWTTEIYREKIFTEQMEKQRIESKTHLKAHDQQWIHKKTSNGNKQE